jgi:hypothetical protein
MKKTPNLLRRCFTLLLFSVFIFCTNDTYATHFRYGNITWERVPGNPYQIKFRITQAWRRDFPFGGPLPNVGSTVNTGIGFNPGSGSIVPITLFVTSVNTTENWIYGQFEYTKTYPSVSATYTASFDGCCRISSLMNNPDRDYRVISTVTVGNSNDAPVSTVPPYISMPVNSTVSYQIPSTDPNGDALTFSLAPNGSFGASTVQPTGLTVSPTGVLSFSTVGKIIGQLYNAVVYVTDSKGARIQLDLMLRITGPSTPPVFDYTVTPGNNANYLIQPGQTLSFNVKALDNDTGDVVTLNALGLPVGATFTSANGNPVTQGFSWTPTNAQLGTYQVNFLAQDIATIQTNSIVNIVVSMRPQFVSPTPGNASTFCYLPGTTISETFRAIDPDTTDSVSISAVTGVAGSMSFSPSLPTAKANPVQTVMTWPTTSADWGQHLLVMKATDKYGESVNDSITYLINHPPVFTSTQPNITIAAGQTFSYTFTTADADSAQGDRVGIENTILPSWLMLTDNNDGSWTISGSPTVADTGIHHVGIEIEDSLNHINGTHCGNASQNFELTVIQCVVTLSKTVTNVLCNGAATGAINITTANTTSPVTYAWSNGATTEDVTGLTAGTYTFALTDANGCTAFDTTIITEPTAITGSISVSPVVTITGHTPYTIYLGYGPQSVTLAASASGGAGGYTYSWSPAATVANPTSASTVVSPSSTTTYTVTITDALGCTRTVSQMIRVVDARCGNNNNKVTVCHYPPGNPGNPQTLCIASSAVAAHLAHGCKVGDCSPAKFNNEEAGENGDMNAQAVKAYPNPTNGYLVIELPMDADNASIQVLDMTGKIIAQKEGVATKATFDLAGAAKGIYMVQVRYNNEVCRTKISIQ